MNVNNVSLETVCGITSTLPEIICRNLLLQVNPM